MRKLTALLLAVLLLFTLTACGSNEDDGSSAPVSSESSRPDSDSVGDSNPQDDPASSDAGNSTTTTGRSRTQATTQATTATINKADYVSTVGEKPYSGNAAILYNKQTSRFDTQAETMRQSILNEPKDTLKATNGGTTYYISPKGDDNNPGTSKNKPWRTTAHLTNHLDFKAGDVVLFERGGIYRNVSFHMTSGVSYGAYGSGAKPCLYGSKQNYADPSLWEKTNVDNVWRFKIGKGSRDVGNLVFDHGKASGIKSLAKTLSVDYQFYHDTSKGYIHLYLSKGNPAEIHSDIEICLTERMMYTLAGYQAENITIENLCLKYTGAHAIVVQTGSSKEAKNITVRGCEIGWVGGGLLRQGVQYGNGIEFNGPIDGALVENNWIYQCYDAGYTNQGSCYQKNITVKNNLIEYCPYNIEVWSAKEIGKGGMENCTFKDNILRFAGYGFGSVARTTVAVGNISFYDYVIPCKNMVISGNIFDCSYRYLVCIAYPNDAEGRGPTIKGNTWNQRNYSDKVSTASVNKLMFNDKEILECKTLDEMKASVARVDLAPKEITLEQ